MNNENLGGDQMTNQTETTSPELVKPTTNQSDTPEPVETKDNSYYEDNMPGPIVHIMWDFDNLHSFAKNGLRQIGKGINYLLGNQDKTKK